MKVLSSVAFFFHRLKTILTSFYVLWTLPQETIDTFMNSYEIYDFDWSQKDKLKAKWGDQYYDVMKRKLVHYYEVLNYLCAIGHVEKMYIPPTMSRDGNIFDNQLLYEELMAKSLGVKEGDRVLDMGCGRGLVATHVHQVTKANVQGFNIDPEQIKLAKKGALDKGLSKHLDFEVGDINEKFNYPDEFFDATYHVQVFSLCNDLKRTMKEVYRVTKPGGKFACLDWVLLPNFDRTNAEHCEILRRVKPLIGAVGDPTVEEYAEAIREAGFEIQYQDDPSVTKDVENEGHQKALIDKAHTWYTRLGATIRFLCRWKIIPAHFEILFERLSKDGEAFIESDRLKIATSSFYFVAVKPK